MKFVNPLFLFGLFAILIPIIIHLFNFRRYKTTYFSNVKLLRNILLKTKRESQLQHLIVLFLRILGIAALVFAFAQPYIPINREQAGGGKLVAVFVDNSYSMEAGSRDGNLLQDAVTAAKNIVNAFDYADEFILTTQDFSAKESRVLNKDEILHLLDEVAISVHSRPLKEITAFQQNIASYSNNDQRYAYYISDFQKQQFDLSALSAIPGQNSFVLQVPAAQINNIAIDSCWFSSPVFTIGQQVSLTVRVHNYGTNDIEKLPVRLFVNDQQRSLAAIDLKANSYADYQMHYNITSPGIQRGVLQIDDTPITFDDQLYLIYEVTESTPVIAIEPKNERNKYLNALYGKDSVFVFTAMNEDQVNYSQFDNAHLIVLNELKGLSSGLADELTKFVERGGALLIFPHEELQQPEWQSFLSGLGVGYYQNMVTQSLKAGKINTESIYYKGSLDRSDMSLDMPTVLKHFEISRSSSVPVENIISLENGDPLLNVYNTGRGKVYISSVALNDDFGQAHKHALFFVPLHNIGIMSQIRNKLYNIIGKDDIYTVNRTGSHSEDLFVVRSEEQDFEFIPGQRNAGNETILYLHSQIQDPGFYDIRKGEVPVSTMAFNYDRKESDLTYYSEKELEEIGGTGEYPFQVIDAGTKNLTDQISSSMNGRPLWRYFILLALLCFLAEVLLLRFWGKAKMRNE